MKHITPEPGASVFGGLGIVIKGTIDALCVCIEGVPVDVIADSTLAVLRDGADIATAKVGECELIHAGTDGVCIRMPLGLPSGGDITVELRWPDGTLTAGENGVTIHVALDCSGELEVAA